MSKHVLVPVADGSEDIEFSCITDILARAEIKVTVASVMAQKTVKLARGLHVTADTLVTDVSSKEFDAVFLPGGLPGANHLGESAALKKVMQEMKHDNKLYGAICAAPVLALSPLGMLEGVTNATCYPSMESKFPAHIKYCTDSVVRCGQCLTSRGPGTAMFFGLAAVALLRSRDVAKSIAKDLLLEKCPEVDHLLTL